MKDPTQKAHFYRSTLKDALPFIPRVSIFHLLTKTSILTFLMMRNSNPREVLWLSSFESIHLGLVFSTVKVYFVLFWSQFRSEGWITGSSSESRISIAWIKRATKKASTFNHKIRATILVYRKPNKCSSLCHNSLELAWWFDRSRLSLRWWLTVVVEHDLEHCWDN